MLAAEPLDHAADRLGIRRAARTGSRISEFAGVALFALALIWLIALVTHDPSDPVWFFTTDAGGTPANFVGRVGAFLSELSLQLFGYTSYLLPGVIATVGWHYFWCQPPDAAYTKVTGVTMFVGARELFLHGDAQFATLAAPMARFDGGYEAVSIEGREPTVAIVAGVLNKAPADAQTVAIAHGWFLDPNGDVLDVAIFGSGITQANLAECRQFALKILSTVGASV